MHETPLNVRAATRLHTDTLLTHANVVGVGAGTRKKSGVTTDEPAVVVYVSHKLPREALEPHELIPETVWMDDTEVRTDVIEVGIPRFVAVDNAQYRPMRGGSQIQTALGGTGTAGAVMYDRRDQSVVLLTNNHVLTNPSSPMLVPTNATVFQPAGGPSIGFTKRVYPIFSAPLGASGYKWAGEVDAGIVSLNGNVAAQFDIVDVAGVHPFVVLPPYEGLKVVRRGYRSQLRDGTVEQVETTVIVTMSNGDRVKIGGTDSVFSIRSNEREIAAMPGDSGSLVVDTDGGASRGLVFASNGQSGGITWACNLGVVMSLLELDTPCNGALNVLIRRSVFRRLADRWSMAELARAGSAGTGNGLIDEQIATMKRFRHGYLGTETEGTDGHELGAALYRLAPALAVAITNDEDAAGLLERAFGDWLVQPTVFDMLEYRFRDESVNAMQDAFRYLQGLGADTGDLDVVASIFLHSGGSSVRELMVNRKLAA